MNREPRTTEQNARFHQLLALWGFTDEEKRALVAEVSEGRCTSSKDLFRFEMEEAIKRLEKRKADSINKMRAKVNYIARDIGMIRPDPRSKSGREDFSALNKFIQNKFHVANLFLVPTERLPDLITALERVKVHRLDHAIKSLLW